jgi:hypothetical protein
MYNSYTATVYTENGAKAINRNLSWKEANDICETASYYGSYSEVTVGKDVVQRSVFIPDYVERIDRSHL